MACDQVVNHRNFVEHRDEIEGVLAPTEVQLKRKEGKEVVVEVKKKEVPKPEKVVETPKEGIKSIFKLKKKKGSKKKLVD